MKTRLSEYKQICLDLPRGGLGVEMHCSDVGLEDPSVIAKAHVRSELKKNSEEEQSTSYEEWIQKAQVSRNANWKLNVALHESENTSDPPKFDKVRWLQFDRFRLKKKTLR